MRGTGLPGSSSDQSTERADALWERWPEPVDDLRQRLLPDRRTTRARVGDFLADVVSPSDQRPLVRRVESYWRWFAVVLFVVVTFDMLSTLYAVEAVGSAGEANPIVRTAIDHGLLTYTALNLAAVVLAIGCFSALVWAIRSSAPPYDRYVEMGLKAWLGLLLAAGLFVFANNLAVILGGSSLIVW